MQPLEETALNQRLIDEIVNAIRLMADANNRTLPTICIIDDEGETMLLSRGDAQIKKSTVIAAVLANRAIETERDAPFDAHIDGTGFSFVLRDLGSVIIGAMGVVAEGFEASKRYAEVARAAFDQRLTLDMQNQD